MRRAGSLLVVVPVLTLLIFGALADRVVAASRAQPEESAELAWRTVSATLRRIAAGVVATRLLDPARIRAPASPAVPDLERPEEDFLSLSGSLGCTESGSGAVAASVALNRPDVSARVAELLL